MQDIKIILYPKWVKNRRGKKKNQSTGAKYILVKVEWLLWGWCKGPVEAVIVVVVVVWGGALFQ